jgi:hypothetical protein
MDASELYTHFILIDHCTVAMFVLIKVINQSYESRRRQRYDKYSSSLTDNNTTVSEHQRSHLSNYKLYEVKEVGLAQRTDSVFYC